mmetsp:Transcript_14114/g.13715  ORF Transcript_14114/g.13715 Transcript_14114/m.13715 type:complete len:114 (-) Transcript_14114:645-986(-)
MVQNIKKTVYPDQLDVILDILNIKQEDHEYNFVEEQMKLAVNGHILGFAARENYTEEMVSFILKFFFEMVRDIIGEKDEFILGISDMDEDDDSKADQTPPRLRARMQPKAYAP